MRFQACISLLHLVSACATSAPSPRESAVRDLRLANLQRAANLPWKDEGRCVVREASQPWPILAERCFHALDRDRVRFRDVTGRCAIAQAGAAAVGGVALCILAAPEIVVGAVVVAGVVVVAIAIEEALEAYERRGPVEPEAGRKTVRPAPRPKLTTQEPLPNRSPKPESSPLGRDWIPPESMERERSRRCEPIPVPHLGKDDAHNKCADRFPPNRYPGMDVLVDGVSFDALQVGVRVLWEIKTHQFDTYPDFIKNQEIEKEMIQIEKQRKAAAACGYGYVVGVSTEAHKAALLEEDNTLKIVVTECKR